MRDTDHVKRLRAHAVQMQKQAAAAASVARDAMDALARYASASEGVADEDCQARHQYGWQCALTRGHEGPHVGPVGHCKWRDGANVTDKQIRDLLALAKAEGRKATVYICKLALDEGATHRTAKEIREARARVAEILDAREGK